MALDLCSLILPNDAHVNVLKEDPCSGKCYAQKRWPFKGAIHFITDSLTMDVDPLHSRCTG